jgi:hypothetical protein
VDSHRPGVTNFVPSVLSSRISTRRSGFSLFGLDCGELGVFSGEWIDRIIGLENVTVEIVMARAPDGTGLASRLPPRREFGDKLPTVFP